VAEESSDDATEDAVASSDSDTADSDIADAEEAEEDKQPDVLLTEAGNVLIDALLLKEQRLVVNEGG
jgi:carboxyl-terminal processing protease